MSDAKQLTIRSAKSDDCELICTMILELAEYERLTNEVKATPEMLRQSLFGEQRCAEALIVEISGQTAGYAIFFTTFSTFTGRSGIYLEDIYIRAEWRNQGLGKALLQRVAQITVQRSGARLEWSVLDWNKPAIEFYRSLGAQPLTEWLGQRLAGPSLLAVAADKD